MSTSLADPLTASVADPRLEALLERLLAIRQTATTSRLQLPRTAADYWAPAPVDPATTVSAA